MTSRPQPGDDQTLNLSLISHTNAGKTTLARTLLGQDIGEVRDAAHVTQQASSHPLLHSPQGDLLVLWDTPGFGDSERLARRLAQAGNPLGWLLTEVWDRFTDRPFWLTQRALRHVAGPADVVLYLVNASESPTDVPWLDAEMQVLALIGKPVVVLLNQLGPPRSAEAESAELQGWHQRLAGFERVREVLALDAFARCWVQEDHLWRAVAAVLPAPRQAVMTRLRQAWLQRSAARWEAAMHLLAACLGHLAADRERLAEPAGWAERARQAGQALSHWAARGWSSLTGHPEAADSAAVHPALAEAQARLARRMDEALRQAGDGLVRLHGLGGQAGEVVRQRVQAAYQLAEPMAPTRTALWSGLAGGAAAGLGADLASGGLSLGAGALVGAVLGALGGMGLAQGVNLVRGVDHAELRWQDAALDEALTSALLTYLAVAHYGRGRGDFSAAEHPAHWPAVVRAAVAGEAAELHRQWATWRAAADTRAAPGGNWGGSVAALDEATDDWFQNALALVLTRLSGRILATLYPKEAQTLARAEPMMPGLGANSGSAE